jgi:hypothetical protein
MAARKKTRKHRSDQTPGHVNNVERPDADLLRPAKCNPDLDPDCEDLEVEHFFAVEWGERLESSKAIARGGKTSGYVPGATGNFP